MEVPLPDGELVSRELHLLSLGAVVVMRVPGSGKGDPERWKCYQLKKDQWIELVDEPTEADAREVLEQLVEHARQEKERLSASFLTMELPDDPSHPQGIPVAAAATRVEGAENLVLVYHRPDRRIRRHRWTWYRRAGRSWVVVKGLRLVSPEEAPAPQRVPADATPDAAFLIPKPAYLPLDDRGISDAVDGLRREYGYCGLRWTGSWLRLKAYLENPPVTVLEEASGTFLWVPDGDGQPARHAPDEVDEHGSRYASMAVVSAGAMGFANHPVLQDCWEVANRYTSDDGLPWRKWLTSGDDSNNAASDAP